jgi:hypothetical protein
LTELRVAAHVHSDWSYDGSWTLGRLAEAFADRNYQVVLTAEHDRTFDAGRWEQYRAACAAASNERVRIVPGIEYSDGENLVHMPVWGAEEFLGRGRPTGEVLADAHACGAVAVIAHPSRRDAWRALPPDWLALASGIEVWNRKYDGWAPSSVGLELSDRDGLLPMVGLDFHTARQFFPLAMVGEISGPVDDTAVIDALRAGRLAPSAFARPQQRFGQGAGLEAARAAEILRRNLARTKRRLASAVGG